MTDSDLRLIEEDSFVPSVDNNYVSWGFHKDLEGILTSKIFYPIYITGLSGNGKTLMVQQACASSGREMVRVNITKRTDELDLFGGYELIKGETVRREGPVITAMRRGAILLLDETDLGTEDLLCLQPVLEGSPYLDKKRNVIVHPAPGFNVVATANTKGKGSMDGRFVGANILNEAFLERFAITIEQEYPSAATEKLILENVFRTFGLTEPDFSKRLIQWAENIRKLYFEGGIADIISTRRLVHIVRAYSIFRSRKKAVHLCLNRFDDETKHSMIEFYEAVDPRYAEKGTAGGLAANTADDMRSFQAKADGSSSIEYVAFAGKLVNEFNVQIVVKNEVVSGIKSVVVYSHGRRTAKPETQMPPKNNTTEFKETLATMIRVNMRDAGIVT